MTMFRMTEDVKGKTLSIFYADGGSETIPETHVSFDAIFNKLVSGTATDDKIRELTNVLETVARKMSALSERVSVDGTNVYFDGDPLAGELTEVIKSLFAEGSANLKPLVNFLEKAKQNPSQKSVDDLYRWIKNGDLVIDPDGDIIAYKGVGKDKDGNSQSLHKGTAFVDGVEFHGHIPNRPGTVVSMPRSEVDPNEMVGCSTGLHAGTHDYAVKYLRWQNANRMILVKINPRDVVSVPTDEADKKMRVSRYTVLSAIDLPDRLQTALYQHDLQTEDLDEDYDEEYDEENWYDEDEEWDEEAEAEEAEAMERAYNTPDSDPYWTAVLTTPPLTPLPIPDEEDEPEDEGDIYDALSDTEKSVSFPNRYAAELAERKAEEEQEEVVLSDVLREALERFTKTDVVAKRDSNGRFVL